MDPHSFSRPENGTVKHIDLVLEVDFGARSIFGRATLHLDSLSQGELVLDTHNLCIKKVTVDSNHADAEYALGDKHEHLGQPLVIQVSNKTNLVQIDYVTGSDSNALQWLDAHQTAGGRMPFLFTQSQTIGARSWIPCQDTPAVRSTYRARVVVPNGMTPVMSAENPAKRRTGGEYEFSCRHSIPSYLFALAVGELESRRLSARCSVYAEPPLASKAGWEFEKIEEMLIVAEKLFGPYRWARCDLIVLPPSFPLGGMENPQLVFVTPTLLVGDRSLTSLLAHELAHSWSGNLVTNATWNDFWLNEGFSVYAEHRIMEELYGKAFNDMLSLLNFRALKKALENLSPRETWLELDLSGRHPDECFTEIPYQKGYFFLRMLEEHFGRDRWDMFLRQYVERFSFKSISSSKFLAYLREQLISNEIPLEKDLHLENWVHGPGLPENCPAVYSTELEQVDAQIIAFDNGASAKNLATPGWTPHHFIYFLSNLRTPVDGSRLNDLESVFRFSDTNNPEILFNWLLLGIASKVDAVERELKRFLLSNGRMKYVKTLYRELVRTREGKKKAEEIYNLARPTYHSAVVRIVDNILEYQHP